MSRNQKLLLAILGLSLLYTFRPSILFENGERNLYAHLAQAFLNGRLDLPAYIHDSAIYNERIFVPFPPFPAVILLPFIALFGIEHTYPVLLALLLAIATAAVYIRLLQKLALDSKTIFWLTLAFFFGTGYWFVTANSSGVWFLAHVVAILAVFLALNESLGRQRGWLVGIFIGIAFLSRQLNLFSAIFVAALLWHGKVIFSQTEGNTDKSSPKKPSVSPSVREDHPSQPVERWQDRLLTLTEFAFFLGIAVVIYLLYNQVRFGSPFDTGYGYLPLEGYLRERVDHYGLFNLAYVPFNFVNLFLQGFHVNFAGSTILQSPYMDAFGTSLTFASPFLFVAFFARWKRILLAAAWLSTTIILVQLLLYFVNGWIQVNAHRYALDFIPILMVLVALGTRWLDEKWWKAAILYAVLLNVIALVFIPLLEWLLIVIPH